MKLWVTFDRESSGRGQLPAATADRRSCFEVFGLSANQPVARGAVLPAQVAARRFCSESEDTDIYTIFTTGKKEVFRFLQVQWSSSQGGFISCKDHFLSNIPKM